MRTTGIKVAASAVLAAVAVAVLVFGTAALALPTPDAGSPTGVVKKSPRSKRTVGPFGLAHATTGVLEICKSSTGTPAIPAGTMFGFSISPAPVGMRVGAAVVEVGHCVALVVPAGQVTVTENATSAATLVGCSVTPAPTTQPVCDQNNRSVTVNVPAGDASNEVTVRFINQAETGLLKICKNAGFGVNAGQPFNFTAGSTALTVNAGGCKFVTATGGSENIDDARRFPIGTQIAVVETTTGYATMVICNPVNRCGAVSNGGRRVVVTIGAGTTIATFTNSLPSGKLRICKVAGTGVAAGQAFNFTAGTTPLTVNAGSCRYVTTTGGSPNAADAREFAFGTQITVTETTTGFTTTVVCDPGVACGAPTNGGRTVVATILSGTTTVYYTNSTPLPAPTGLLKICKNAGTGVSAGQTFNFTAGTTALTVNAGGCKFVTATGGSENVADAREFPVGTEVTVTETTTGFTTSVVCNPAGRCSAATNGGRTVVVTIGTGTTIVTFTNAVPVIPSPTGTIQICKTAGNGVNAGQAFNFTADTTALTVNAGNCRYVTATGGSPNATDARQFQVGTQVTVTETTTGFVTNVVCSPAARCGTATNNGRTVVVTVGSGNTAVVFTNSALPAPPPGPDCPSVVVTLNRITVTVVAPAGLASITPTALTRNMNVSIPNFTVGTTSPVVVTATRISRALPARLDLLVRDVLGRTVSCDPILATMRVGKARFIQKRFNQVPSEEHKLIVQNGRKGLRRIAVSVAGKTISVKLRAGEKRIIDIRRLLRPGSNNTVTITGYGRPGAHASIILTI